jgi:TRAP-type C4-dicarboxylate transport system permease small subunit
MSLIHANGPGSISTIIGGIAPNWGPFAGLGNQARAVVEVIMAMAILVCFGLCAWGAARQRIGQGNGMASMTNAEQGKGMIISGLVGVFIIGSLGTVFTIVYGMAI